MFSANPNAPDKFCVTPLHRAARQGSERCLQLLLDHGADVNARVKPFESVEGQTCKFEVGSTALHHAARGDHVKCVKLLLNFGADCNLTDDKHQTPLYLACKEGLPECVLTLIHTAQAYGLPILSIPTTDNNTPLHECLRNRSKMAYCVRELVGMGADVSLPNIMNETPIHVAIELKWRREIIDLLILEGHGMDFDRSKPRSPLLKVLYSRLQSVCYHKWERTCDHCHLYHKPHVDQENSLAVFFVQMGASRRSLQHLLWWELNRQAPQGVLLDTLLNAFATPPSLPHLERRFSISEDMVVLFADNTLIDPCPKYSMVDMDAEPDSSFRRTYTPLNTPALPYCHVVHEKKKEYAKRCSQVPSLAHLGRMAVRSHLQADVRNVLSFPIPDKLKTYILLGYEVPPHKRNTCRTEEVGGTSGPGVKESQGKVTPLTVWPVARWMTDMWNCQKLNRQI
ncbi:hypothetical protein ACOMHN_059778 [Nucella lapillus]